MFLCFEDLVADIAAAWVGSVRVALPSITTKTSDQILDAFSFANFSGIYHQGESYYEALAVQFAAAILQDPTQVAEFKNRWRRVFRDAIDCTMVHIYALEYIAECLGCHKQVTLFAYDVPTMKQCVARWNCPNIFGKVEFQDVKAVTRGDCFVTRDHELLKGFCTRLAERPIPATFRHFLQHELQKTDPLNRILKAPFTKLAWATSKPLPSIVKKEGIVIHGHNRGSTRIGCPTANIDGSIPFDNIIIPGVYRGTCWLPQMTGDKMYRCVLSVGFSPFFGNRDATFEVYVFHRFDGLFYGEKMVVHISHFLRPESKFASFQELIFAIQADCECVMADGLAP